MAISLEHAIIPMSDLRIHLDKVKDQLKKSPVVITNNGRPDFGVCDLETLEIAFQVKELRALLKSRAKKKDLTKGVEEVFRMLDKKHNA